MHDHAGLWGLELVLIGALEVQSWRRAPTPAPCARSATSGLTGDGTWFEGDRNHLRRCRNLSQHETAFTLHVYGGELTRYLAYEQAGPAGTRTGRAQKIAVAGCLGT